MVAFTTRMPLGFPGRISRDPTGDATVETALIDSNTPPTVYGQAVKLVAGKLQPVVSGDAADIDGLLVNAYPTQSSTTALGAATPPTSGLIDVLKRGYMIVHVARGTPVAGGVVALRVTAGAHTAGEWEGDATNVGQGDSDCVAVTNAYWMGAADADGNAELAFNI